MDGTKLCAALRRTFAARRTHELPTELPFPPSEWAVPYRVLAGTLGLPAELAEAYRIAAALVGPALQGQAIGMWESRYATLDRATRTRLACLRVAQRAVRSQSHAYEAVRRSVLRFAGSILGPQRFGTVGHASLARASSPIDRTDRQTS